jgi:riboflavin synthase alpha subunit
LSHRCGYGKIKFSADVAYETLKVTDLGELRMAKSEPRAGLQLSARIGGHLVTGHVMPLAGFRRRGRRVILGAYS